MTFSEEKRDLETGSESSQDPPKHCIKYIVLVVCSWLAFALTAAFNGMATAGTPGVFNNQTGNIADELFIEITPAGFVFSTSWSIIYVYQALFLVYSAVQIFVRVNGAGTQYLYTSYYGISAYVYVLYIFNMLMNMGWILLWDRRQIWVALVFIVGVQATLYGMLFLMLRKFPEQRERNDHKCYFTSLRIYIAHTAIAIYAAWLTIAPLLNFAVCLTYSAGMLQQDASTLMLVILMLFVIVWFPLELTLFRSHFRYIYMHYLPLCMAPIGIIVKMAQLNNGVNDWSQRNAILSLVIAILVIGFYVVKIVHMIYCICCDKFSGKARCGVGACGNKRSCSPNAVNPACGPTTPGEKYDTMT